MSKLFEITRGSFMRFLAGLDETTADVQLNGFNNTIRWQIGHLLVSGESFLFGYPKKSSNIPASYAGLFGMSTKPSDWNGDIPSLPVLINYLEEQTSRIRELSNDFFEQNLPFQFPVGNIQTYRELFEFMAFHEADHVGQMKAMKRFIESK